MSEKPIIYETIPISTVSEENVIKINTYSIRRTLIFIASIDFIIELLNGLSYLLDHDKDTLNLSYSSFVCSGIVLIGIIGINKYHLCTSRFYGFYVILKIIGYFLVSISYHLNFYLFLFLLIIIMLNFWIVKLLCKFINNIKSLPEQEINNLRLGWKPIIQKVILI